MFKQFSIKQKKRAIISSLSITLWKKGDSNPRYAYTYGSLANCWFQPLTHPSRPLADCRTTGNLNGRCCPKADAKLIVFFQLCKCFLKKVASDGKNVGVFFTEHPVQITVTAVEPHAGLEPATYALRMRCSTN